MQNKTFHFGPENQEALEDLIEAYLALTSLCVFLRGMVGDDPYLAHAFDVSLRDGDLALVRFIKGEAPSPN